MTLEVCSRHTRGLQIGEGAETTGLAALMASSPSYSTCEQRVLLGLQPLFQKNTHLGVSPGNTQLAAALCQLFLELAAFPTTIMPSS